uniref:Uncharacterized protein n=1 Tax=Arundo donax TaxID=35708 RepID=A0A0A9EHH2_ARUDO
MDVPESTITPPVPSSWIANAELGSVMCVDPTVRPVRVT